MHEPPLQPVPPGDGALASEVTPALEAPLDRGFAPYLRVFRRLGPAGPLALLAASVPAITGFYLVKKVLPLIAPWLRGHPIEGILIYVLGFTVVGGLAILPTWAHSVLGGWAFGFHRGYPAAVASIIGGSLVGYIVGRFASGRRVVELLEEHPRTRAVYDCLLRSSPAKSLLVVTLIRVPPSSPYAVTNLALAAARVNPVIYLLGTFLGIAPRTGIVVWIASRLSQLSFDDPHRGWTIAIMIASTLVVLSILSNLANRAIARVTTEPVASLDVAPPAGSGP